MHLQGYECIPLTNWLCSALHFTVSWSASPVSRRFTIDFKRGNDIAFHCNPRFNDEGKKVVVRNSLVNGRWGPEERKLTQFPFVEGQPFEVQDHPRCAAKPNPQGAPAPASPSPPQGQRGVAERTGVSNHSPGEPCRSRGLTLERRSGTTSGSGCRSHRFS